MRTARPARAVQPLPAKFPQPLRHTGLGLQGCRCECTGQPFHLIVVQLPTGASSALYCAGVSGGFQGLAWQSCGTGSKESGSAPKIVTSASLHASISPAWTQVGNSVFWQTVTLVGTGARRWTMASVALTRLRETASSNLAARPSSLLRLYACTAPLTTAVCDMYCRDSWSFSKNLRAPRHG